MTVWIILVVLVALAIAAPLYGADTRTSDGWTGRDDGWTGGYARSADSRALDLPSRDAGRARRAVQRANRPVA